MRVLLTFPPATDDLDTFKGINRQTATAIYLLGEILRNNDIEPKIVDTVNYYNENNEVMSVSFVEDMIKDVDIVAISSNTFNWYAAKRLIGVIRKINKTIPIVLGGVHPTMMDVYVLKSTEADAVARNEGEITFPKLIKEIMKKGIKELYDVQGVTFKNSLGEIIRNPDRPSLTVEEYNNVVLPNYSEMPKGFYVGIPCETSRGCLYNCAFCGIMNHNSWKSLCIENCKRQIDNSIKWTKEKCTSSIIFIGDDCASVDKDRLVSMFKYIGSKKDDFKVFMEGRIGDLKDESISEVIPVNKIMRFLVGIESGYNEGLKLVRKGYDIETIDKIFSQYKGKKIIDSMFCSFIVGLPWESYDECIKTVQFAAHIYKDYGVKSNISWWSLIPSYLWDVRDKYKIDVDESIFDHADWYRLDAKEKNSFFLKCHPNLSVKDFMKVEKVIKIYSDSGVKIIDN